LALGYALVFFSMGSRRFAMVPLLFAVGGLGSAPRSRAWKVGIAAAALASFTLIYVSLYTRSLPEHGLWPYVQALPGITETRYTWKSLALNLLIGYGVIGRTAFDIPPINQADFLVSVNPLPGGLSGWYQIADDHRLNLFTPMAALGELGNLGWPSVIGYCGTVGFVLAYLDLRVRGLMERGRQLHGLLLLALTVLFTVLSTGYNLRTATRMLYYALALDALTRGWIAIRGRRRRGVPAPSEELQASTRPASLVK
jgi:hypothetical protein